MLKALSVSRYRFWLFVVLAIGLVSLIGCAAPAAAPAAATPEAAGAPTRNARTPLPLPPQPTSVPATARAAVPFASPTFSTILEVAPRAVGTPPTLAPTAAPTRAPATSTPAAAGATAPAGAGARAEIKVDFVIPLGSAEFIEEVAHKMAEFNGIVGVSGNELSATIVYNPALITPAQIRQRLASIGNEVKP